MDTQTRTQSAYKALKRVEGAWKRQEKLQAEHEQSLEEVEGLMVKAIAAGATWDQIGDAMGGRPKGSAHQWFSRRQGK